MQCPVDKVDDLVVLGMILCMAVMFACFGQWEAATNIANALVGAGAMYLKGQS